MSRFFEYFQRNIGLIAGTLVGFTVGLIGWMAVLNSSDIPLKPEVTQILEKKVEYSHYQQAAFHYALGLYAGEMKNPHKRGEQLWMKFLKLKAKDKNTFWREAVHKIDPWSKPYALLAYAGLISYGSGATVYRGDADVPVTGIKMIPLPAMHRRFTAQLAQNMRVPREQNRALAQLELSNRYLVSFLKSGNLYERSLAIINLDSNANFLRAQLRGNSRIRISPKLIDSFTAPDADTILKGAFEIELRHAANLVPNFRSDGDLILASRYDPQVKSSMGFSQLIPVQWFMRPNETLNKLYEIGIQSLSAHCPPNSESGAPDCIPAASWLHPRWPWQRLKNPLGRSLVSALNPTLEERRKGIHLRLQRIDKAKLEFVNHL